MYLRAMLSMKQLVYILILVPLFSFAEIYKWKDASGRVHYGDSPSAKENAEQIVLDDNSYEHVTYDDGAAYDRGSTQRVVMYSTSWCGYCKKARKYFQQEKINYVEYDIEKDERARRLYDMIGGKGVPVILVGKKRLNGFSVAGFERIFN